MFDDQAQATGCAIFNVESNTALSQQRGDFWERGFEVSAPRVEGVWL
jgi:hypothetical protein